MNAKKTVCVLQIAALFVFCLSVALMPIVSDLYYATSKEAFIYVNSALFWGGLIFQLILFIVMKRKKIEFCFFKRLLAYRKINRKKYFLFNTVSIAALFLFSLIFLFIIDWQIIGFILASIAIFFVGLNLFICKCTGL